MFSKLSIPSLIVIAVIVAGVAIVGWRLFSTPASEATVEVTVPQLSVTAQQGNSVFDANCASCHGVHASGTDQGPPLVHKIYEPGHHADFAFVRAVRNGVRAHHWPYGDMAPVEGLSDEKVSQIIVYVRELQKANGIKYRPHRMQ